ncbi:hypothetical protein [Paenibacillus sp. JGP012]|uniref:hypothetical protein n=1 Tax=Paenibacillus sp. JGP012 TaxID=2735914 RepID=UPI001620A182|nr:hypothetical protein [Paenibacillus sp. JGP012]
MTFAWLVHRFASLIRFKGAQALFGTKPMQPSPIYFVAAASSALVVLMICIEAAEGPLEQLMRRWE